MITANGSGGDRSSSSHEGQESEAGRTSKAHFGGVYVLAESKEGKKKEVGSGMR